MRASIVAAAWMILASPSVDAGIVAPVPLPDLSRRATYIVVGAPQADILPSDLTATLMVQRVVKGPPSLETVTAFWPTGAPSQSPGESLFGLWFVRAVEGRLEFVPYAEGARAVADSFIPFPLTDLDPDFQYTFAEPVLDRLVKELRSALEVEPEDDRRTSRIFSALASVAHPSSASDIAHPEQVAVSHEVSCAVRGVASTLDGLALANVRARVQSGREVPPGLLAALCQATHPDAVSGLSEINDVAGSTVAVKRCIAQAARNIHTPDAAALLRRLLDDSDVEARFLAVDGLALYANNYLPGEPGFGSPAVSGSQTTVDTQANAPSHPVFIGDPEPYLAFWRNWCAEHPCRRNGPPTVSVMTQSTCSPTCVIAFSAQASDPDGELLSHSWSGCATGSGDSVTCSQGSAGSLAATVTVTDMGRLTATTGASVTVHGAAYNVGAWGSCNGSGAFTCTSAASNGCTRPGTQTRTVTESAWTVVESEAAAQPASAQGCTEVAQGYVASYYVGPWGACNVSCGGGTRYRTVNPNIWTTTGPSVPPPGDSQSCNTQSCELTCYDYPNAYPTWDECYGAGFPVCETRYRSDGVGGWLTCRVGFY